MSDYGECNHLGYIIKLFGIASTGYEADCNYIGYVLAWDSPPGVGVFPTTCYLITFGSGILMLVIVHGGVRIVDGLLADVTGENIVVAPFSSLYEKAREYRCKNIEMVLKKIEEEDRDILEKISRECERLMVRRQIFADTENSP